MRGSLVDGGAVMKVTGQTGRLHRGPAKVLEREEDAFAAIRNGGARRRGPPPRRGTSPTTRSRSSRTIAVDAGRIRPSRRGCVARRGHRLGA
ncbi:hypothetical protein [uncultured Methylobacterium sp.]|uniref:hypothetical protein n=1 Tax=uncultured Methylobacterium sp. TaxID=157278 RepID=UPI00338F2A4B